MKMVITGEKAYLGGQRWIPIRAISFLPLITAVSPIYVAKSHMCEKSM